MTRAELFKEAVRQFLEAFPDIDASHGSQHDKSALDDIRFLLDLEHRRTEGTVELSDAERDQIDRLGMYGKNDADDAGPGRFGGYAMHDLGSEYRRLGMLLCKVQTEAIKMRSELLQT